jgi:hypothetical protein
MADANIRMDRSLIRRKLPLNTIRSTFFSRTQNKTIDIEHGSGSFYLLQFERTSLILKRHYLEQSREWLEQDQLYLFDRVFPIDSYDRN